MDLLEQVASPLRLLDEIRSIDALAPLDSYQDELVADVAALLDSGADVLGITAAVALVNDELTRRLIRLAEDRLGAPPCPYAWLALGSHGRGEQVLSSDQDSALAFADLPPDEQPAARDHFLLLAGHVVSGLARAGIPRCPGGYMATGWCRSLPEFAALFRGWVEAPQRQALLEAEVFLDVRPVHGELSTEVLTGTLVVGGTRGPFTAQMARAAMTFRPPLGAFGRLHLSDGQLDVKRAGTATIVLLARLYALAAGSAARTTLSRLDAGTAGGGLSRARAGQLAEVYRFLTWLRLEHQVQQVRRGLAPDNLVRPAELAAQDQRQLRAHLAAVRDAQDAMAACYGTFTVT